MSKPVYVSAIWSYAHNAWVEFVVSADPDVVRRVCAPLIQYTATHVRIVRVARDDWALILPALAALGAPVKSYSPKEFEMWCDERRSFGDDLLSGEGEDAVASVEPAPVRRRRAA